MSPRARIEREVRELVRGRAEMLSLRLRGPMLDELASRLLDRAPELERWATIAATARARLLGEAVPRVLRELEDRDAQEARALADLRALLERLPDEMSRRRAIRDHLVEHSQDPIALVQDLRAVSRFLDLDVIAERVSRATEKRGALAELGLRFLGSLGAEIGDDGPLRGESELAMALHTQMHSRRWQTTHAAVDATMRIGMALRERGVRDPLAPSLVTAMLARIRDPEEHFSVAMRALDGIAWLPPPDRLEMLREVLLSASDERRATHALVRHRALKVSSALLEERALELLIEVHRRHDSSELVRMAVAEELAGISTAGPARDTLRSMVGSDRSEESPRVRAIALRALCQHVTFQNDEPSWQLRVLLDAFDTEQDTLVLETACEALGELAERIAGESPHGCDMIWTVLVGAITKVRSRATLAPAAHQAAAVAFERIDAARSAPRREVAALVRAVLNETPKGKMGVLPLSALSTASLALVKDPRWLGRVLAELSRDAFGVTASVRERHIELHHGDVFRVRAWRVLHEVRNRAPNKRQAFRHTVGRRLLGEIRAHPGRMDEVTATTVPGERVTIDGQAGWCRYLPTVDDALDLPLGREGRAYVASSHGITVLSAPPALRERLRAKARLTLHYARFAALRLASLRGVEPSERRAYIEALERELGVQVEFYPHGDCAISPDVSSTLPRLRGSHETEQSALALALISPGLDRLVDWALAKAPYFLSTEANGQPALAVFVGLMLGGMMVRSHAARRRMTRARAAIPLSIGGWGTRGKSGTERIKSALFHGLGYQVMVKTTGCEAMFIHSVPGQRPLEVFIYRPYDKATIWEQARVAELAARLESEVFLWECMALNPRYVEVLAHQWMRDDYTTLTNAFPDHEDIQGPAGQNVAEVISRFIPKRGTCFTSEVNFLPLMQERARELETELVAVPASDGDLLPADLLALFPYQEHPRNIALMARMAEHFGIDRWTAIALMAENVVPDLGVLKTYPDVVVRGRKLRFMNGMSANERTGCTSNWRRMGLDRFDPDSQPEETVVTVVNNRDDRVSRSEVFGRILVEDIAADRHVLIGTNLGGLVGYAEAALARWVAQIEIMSTDGGGEGSSPEERLRRWMLRLRIPSPNAQAVLDRLELYARGGRFQVREEARATITPHIERLLEPQGTTSIEELRREFERDTQLRDVIDKALEAWEEEPFEGHPEILEPADRAAVLDHFFYALGRIVIHARLRARIPRERTTGAIGAYHQELRTAYSELFRETLIIIQNPKATGDQIIDTCARTMPPGTRVTVMGVQNIKGTGLDFAYRWVALGQVVDSITELSSTNPARRARAFSELETFGDHGLVDSGLGRLRLRDLSSSLPTQAERDRARTLATKLEVIFGERRAGLLSAGKARGGPLRAVVHGIERFVDHLDAVGRAKNARAIMDDLVAQRISIARASLELRRLTARQKGGWLFPWLDG